MLMIGCVKLDQADWADDVVDFPRLEVPAMGQNAPGDTGELVGERDCQHIAVQPLLGGFDPGLEPMALPALAA
jgi:hypothetical protein